MTLSKRDFLKGFGAATLLPQPSFAANNYPVRPVKMIVPYSPGGASDATFRILAEHFQRVTGQSMVVENRPGASSIVAMNYLKQQPADGYVLGLMSRASLAQYWIQGAKNVPHPIDDFTFVSAVNGSIFALVTNPSSRLRSLADVIAAAKAEPGKLTVGNIGLGTAHYLTAAEFARLSGIDLLYPSFKGESDSINALLGGHIDLAVASGSVMPTVESGNLDLLALATEQRLPDRPNLLTFSEQGYAVTMDTTVGVGGPKGMDPAIVSDLNQIFKRITADSAFVASLNKLYQPVRYMDTQPYNDFMRARLEIERLLIERYGLKQP